MYSQGTVNPPFAALAPCAAQSSASDKLTMVVADTVNAILLEWRLEAGSGWSCHRTSVRPGAQYEQGS